jgi:FkbM family methyltransferase
MLGLQVSRLPSEPDEDPAARLPVAVGKHRLVTNSQALRRAYEDFPDSNDLIRRIVAFLTGARGAISTVDIGANCGDTAAVAREGGAAEVLAIEGDDAVYSLLELNAAQIGGVVPCRAYLGERSEAVAFNISRKGWNSTLTSTGENGASTTIGLRTLDDVVADWLPKNRLGFIKCDAEGFDTRILIGSKATLIRSRPALLFEHNCEAMDEVGEDSGRIFPFLADLGYHDVHFYEPYGRLLLATNLGDRGVIADMVSNAGGPRKIAYFYDVLAFHRDDAALAARFTAAERARRPAHASRLTN